MQGNANVHGVLPFGLPSIVLLAEGEDLQRSVEQRLAHVGKATVVHFRRHVVLAHRRVA